jgi:hypothetical protein
MDWPSVVLEAGRCLYHLHLPVHPIRTDWDIDGGHSEIAIRHPKCTNLKTLCEERSSFDDLVLKQSEIYYV